MLQKNNVFVYFMIFLGVSACVTQTFESHEAPFNPESFQRLDYLLKKFNDLNDPYGKISKNTRFKNKSYKEIEAILVTKHGCHLKKSFVNNHRTETALKCKGSYVPMILFKCKDLSLIRVKVNGNPCDKFHSQPHLTKEVLFKGKKFDDSFNSVAFKVDETGVAQPKWPKDAHSTVNLKEWGTKTHPLIRKKRH